MWSEARRQLLMEAYIGIREFAFLFVQGSECVQFAAAFTAQRRESCLFLRR